MKLPLEAYSITKEDLKKTSYGINFESYDDNIIQFFKKEKEQKNPYLSDQNLRKLERHAVRDIRFSIYSFGLLGIGGTIYGLYFLINNSPRIAVNLRTHFPLIDNGSVTIVFGLALLIGSIYSYRKRKSILITKVKSKIITYCKKGYGEGLDKRLLQRPGKKRKVRHKPKKKR